VVALVVLCAPAEVAAQRALLVAEAEVPPALRAAVEAATGLDVVERAGLRGELRTRAAALGEDPADAAAAEALGRAHRAYLELRLGPARAAYGEALEARLGSARAPADPAWVARLLFERALVHLAAHRRQDAQRDLRGAIAIDEGFEPDREVYGAPLLEQFDRARRARLTARTIALRGVPEGATVRVDGAIAAAETEVRGEGPHLVSVTRLGSAPRSWLVTARARRTELDVALEDAPPALLARQLLEVDEAPLALWLRAARVDRVLRVRRLDDALDVTLTEAEGQVIARAVGERVEWEPRPWFVLAERLAGREVPAPLPPPVLAPAALAVAAPSTVHPREPIALRLTLRDPDAVARALRAACGASSAEAAAAERAELELRAPAAIGALGCEVHAVGPGGDVLVRRELSVDVVEAPSDDTGWWVLGGAIAAGLATAITILAVVLYEPPQRLVIGGLDP